MLTSYGVDHPAQKITGGPRQYTPTFLAPFSAAIKAAHGDKILVGAVGRITAGPIAQVL